MSPFWEFYFKLYNHHRTFLTQIQKENVSLKSIQKAHENFVGHVHSTVHATDLGDIFVDLAQQKKVLREMLPQAPLLHGAAEDLVNQLESIWDLLSDLMRSPRHFPLIINFLNKLESIEKKFQYFENCGTFLNYAGKLLIESAEPPDNFDVMDLGFSVDVSSLADLNFRLNSLQMVYTETCLLFEVTENNFPLKVSKIESGTLWGRVFGESKVIAFIIWFLKNSIRYLHRSFTIEGKLAKIPTDVETLDKQFHLLKKAKELLPEKRYEALVAEQGEALAKSSAMLAKYTQNLLEREANLRIGSEIYQIEQASQKKYLEIASKQLTEHTKFNDPDPESIENQPELSVKDEKANANKGRQDS